MVVKGGEMERSETIVFLVVKATEWWEAGQKETKSSDVVGYSEYVSVWVCG